MPREEHRKTVGEWLSRPFVWRIPVYQRHYAWDTEKKSGPIHLFWETVEEQSIARLQGKKTDPHYLGAILVDNKTKHDAMDGITRYDVVDGQQRLTTIQLALLALVKVATDLQHDNEIKNKVEGYIFSGKNSPEFCLNPANLDGIQYEEVVFDVFKRLRRIDERDIPVENLDRSKIILTFRFFKKCYESILNEKQHEPEDALKAVLSTLTEGLDIVLIVLRESDKAQKIFQSLNSFSEPLTTFDLIRNNIFYRAACIPVKTGKIGKDEELFKTSKWQSLEDPYWEEKSDNKKTNPTKHIEAYIARMLVAKRKEIILFNRNSIFSSYKDYFEKNESIEAIEKEIIDITEYMHIYQYLDSNNCKNPIGDEVDFGIFRYSVWKNRDFYPVLFIIATSNNDKQEKKRMIRLLENYIIRREVCGLTGRSYNKKVPSMCKTLGDEPSYEDLHEILASAEKDTALFPTDEIVKEKCVYNNKFYETPLALYILKKIEHSMYERRVEIIVEKDILTIDHILPKRWERNEEWRKMVLVDKIVPDTINQSLIDTIGNLTLMSGLNNSVKSNRSFDDAKKVLGKSVIKLNKELAQEEVWNVEKIAARSRKLAEKICEIWPYDIA